MTAYSIAFADQRHDESPFARATAAAIGMPISVAMFDDAKARAILPEALLAYDEPFGDSSSLATLLLARHVARDVKVALGGDGGDEVFAGYKKYLVASLRRPFTAVPRLRNAVGRLLARIPVQRDRSRGWKELLWRLNRLATSLDGTDADVYVKLTQFDSLARTSALMRRPTSAARFEAEAKARFHQARGSELQRSLASDLGSMLGNDMLAKVDRASMACSLEARVPFLDHRLVEYGVGLPAAYTLGPRGRTFSGKRVLRTLHERRFGPALARRKKHGFTVPVQRWLQGAFDPACERLFDRRRLDRFGILSSAELSGGGFRRWVASEPRTAWHAFALAAWCEATLGDGPDALREMLSPRPSAMHLVHRGAPACAMEA